MQIPALDGGLSMASQWATHRFSCIPFTWSGNVVSLSSRSSSAYVKIVFRERRKNSSLKFWDVPTRDDRDMVTCIFTLAKFCNRDIVRAFQTTWRYCKGLLQHQHSGHCTLLLTGTWHKQENSSFANRLSQNSDYSEHLVPPNFIIWWHII